MAEISLVKEYTFSLRRRIFWLRNESAPPLLPDDKALFLKGTNGLAYG
jgi:hypothetical protein